MERAFTSPPDKSKICSFLRLRFVTTAAGKGFGSAALHCANPPSPYTPYGRLAFTKCKALSSSFAFTLAEVLITLAIIGVVAALTVPAIVKNYQDVQYKVAYKKAYSDAARVWNLMAANSEIETRKTQYIGGMATNDFPNFKSYFNVTKECSSTDKTCFTNTDNAEVFSEYNNKPSGATFIDSQGRSWGFVEDNYFEAAYILVDTNGNKKPNVLGKDRFPFATMPIGCTWNSEDIQAARCYTNVIPVKLLPLQDTNYNRWCKSMKKCYYTTWLSK
jgi:prepilin-type N-terminal cleavage/methylation domain-containing protein